MAIIKIIQKKSRQGHDVIMFQIHLEDQIIAEFEYPLMSRNTLKKFIAGQNAEDQNDEGFFISLKDGIVRIEHDANSDAYEATQYRLRWEDCKPAFEEIAKLYPVLRKANCERFGEEYHSESEEYDEQVKEDSDEEQEDEPEALGEKFDRIQQVDADQMLDAFACDLYDPSIMAARQERISAFQKAHAETVADKQREHLIAISTGRVKDAATIFVLEDLNINQYGGQSFLDFLIAETDQRHVIPHYIVAKLAKGLKKQAFLELGLLMWQELEEEPDGLLAEYLCDTQSLLMETQTGDDLKTVEELFVIHEAVIDVKTSNLSEDEQRAKIAVIVKNCSVEQVRDWAMM